MQVVNPFLKRLTPDDDDTHSKVITIASGVPLPWTARSVESDLERLLLSKFSAWR